MSHAPITSEILDQTPPNDLTAEAGVIGSILIDASQLDAVAGIVQTEDFYREENKTIFETIRAMQDAGEPIDATVLLARLKARDGETPWTGLLAEISGQVPHSHNSKFYAKIVRDKAQHRRIIDVAARTLQASYLEQDTPAEIASYSESMLNAAVGGSVDHAPVPIGDAVSTALQTAKGRADGSRPGGLPIGIEPFDRATGGLFGGELTILAARPRVGKTALATQIAVDVAGRGHQVLLVSLEMSGAELAGRMLCSRAQVNTVSFRTGKLLPADLSDLENAATTLSSARLLLLDAPTASLADIRRTARTVQARHGLALVVIDYLQLIQAENPRDPRQEQVSKIARGLKGLARELETPVLCAAQLNRGAANSKDGSRPRLSHLRESGAIEQDSDMVLALHRDEIHQPNDDDVAGKAELLTLKNRSGPARDYELHFDGPTQTFSTRSLDWDPSEEF